MFELLVPSVLIVLAFVVLVISVAFIRLQRAFKTLKADYDALAAQLRRNTEDVAGLCSAALAVDRRLVSAETQISRFGDDVVVKSQPVAVEPPSESYAESPSGYDKAIQMIRRGSDADALVKNCGLTRDEAVLLIRLHGR